MPFATFLALITMSMPSAPIPAEMRVTLAAGGATQASDKGRFRPWGRPGTDIDLGPPPDPGNEPRLAADPSGVAAGCSQLMKPFNERGEKILRVVISQNRRYGVVWRADSAMGGRSEPDERLLCWRSNDGHSSDGFHLVARPLEMFNPRQSIAPLQPSSPTPPPSR